MIIFQKGGNFWIESHELVRATVAAGAARTDTITLDRPGTFVGAASTTDADNSAGGAAQVRTVGGAFLAYGTFVTQVEGLVRNFGAGSIEVGYRVLIFLRK